MSESAASDVAHGLNRPFYNPQARTTRLGRVFSTIADWGSVKPVVCPPEFEILPLLKGAVELDNSDYFESFNCSEMSPEEAPSPPLKVGPGVASIGASSCSKHPASPNAAGGA